MKYSLYVIIICFIFSGTVIAQEPMEHHPEEHDMMPVILEIPKLATCPARIVSLSLGKIKVTAYQDGSSQGSKMIPGPFTVEPVVVDVHLMDARQIIWWFKRIKQQKQERKTVHIVFPEQGKVSLWYGWPATIQIVHKDHPMPVARISFVGDNIEFQTTQEKPQTMERLNREMQR